MDMWQADLSQSTGTKTVQGRYSPAPAPPSRLRIFSAHHFLHSSRELSRGVRKEIEQKLSFLQPVLEDLHSVVIVGSTVFGKQSEYSDLDVVIITTEGGHEEVCSALFEEEIRLNDRARNFDCTVLTPVETEKLFQVASPFAYSILHGVVFSDDGYLAGLRNKENLGRPGREYYTGCLSEKIILQYYMALRQYRNGADQIKNPGSRDDERTWKPLHTLEEQFARLIIHMLYVTLPSQGMIPLTKSDIIYYAEKAYGAEGERIARIVLAMVHHQPVQFSRDEYNRLKEFTVRLFREILHFMGTGDEVRKLIADAINMMRGRYTDIKNEAVRNCFV